MFATVLEVDDSPAPPRPVAPDADLSAAGRRSIEALYRQHGAALRRFVRTRLRSDSDAEDVLQDVFVRICRRGDTQTLQSPAAVLYKTAFRLALNVIRRRRNSPIDGGCEIDALDLPSPGRSPEEDLLVRRECEALLRAIGALPPQCQRVLTLRTIEGLSYDEMAAQLGLSVSTLEKHVVKGRRILRQHHRPDGDGPERRVGGEVISLFARAAPAPALAAH